MGCTTNESPVDLDAPGERIVLLRDGSEAIGAFLVSALLMTVAGFSGVFERIMNRIPVAIASGMLAGVLLRFGLDAFVSLKSQFGLVAGMFVVYLAGRRFVPRYAVIGAFAAGIVVAAAQGLIQMQSVRLQWAQPVWTTPQFSLGALVGALLIAARLLRLGFVANFISTPVLTGFKAGIGLVIVLDQVPKLIGVHIHKQGFLRDVVAIAQQLPATSWLTLAVAGAIFALLVGMERWKPHSPAPLLAVGLAIAAAALFGLQGAGVATVGDIPRGLPALVRPHAGLVEALLPGALGIALMSFTETIAAARAFAAPGDPPVDANRELVATGCANLAGALLGAMPAGGGTSQTAVVRSVGGRSQRASLVTAAAALATMGLLAPLLGLLPQATLAAIVIVYSVGLVDPAEFRAIRSVRTMEFRWALAAAFGVLVFGTLQGIVAAIVLSMIGLSSQTAHPRVSVIGRKRGADVLRPRSSEHPHDETFPGLLVVRPEGRLYFANAQYVYERIDALVAANFDPADGCRLSGGHRNKLNNGCTWRKPSCRQSYRRNGA